MKITLPWPPSVNTYWRHPTRGALAGRHLISAEGRAYRTAVQAEWMAGIRHGRLKFTGPLQVEILAYPPDRRKRDLDNICKSLLDAMTHAGIWLDDSQVDDLRIKRARSAAGIELGGRVEITITQLDSGAA